MREIKFRAWDSKLKKMIVPDFIDNQNGKALKSQGCNDPCPYHEEEGFGVPVMQFTGLKDKNGKEIYESDVVKTKSPWANVHEDLIGVVEWNDFHGAWSIRDNGNGPNVSFPDGREVIGNIHENPELLK